MQIHLIIILILVTCNPVNKNSKTTNDNQTYWEYRKEFDRKLTRHFPKEIGLDEYFISCKTNRPKNDVGLILYYYKVDEFKIASIKRQLDKMNIIGQYLSKDSCLLVINPFETLETNENGEVPQIKDSSKINRDCFKELYPIPNFIDYQNPNLSSELKLDNSFVIYILEARSGRYFKKFDMQPSPQMPKNWSNGYSLGIAISDQDKTVVYWTSIW